MNEIITAETGESALSAAARAIQITERIRANGRTAVNAVCAIGKDLRTMKIDNLYPELGYETFEDYAEKEFDLKRRQAYQYISVYDRLGEEFVQSNAQLGITKLALLAAANPEDRAEVMGTENVQNMTTRELEELLDKYKQQGEQLSMLQEKNTELEAKVEELESAPKDVEIATREVPVPDKQTEEELKKKTQELISANAEKESIKKELNSANAELQLEKTANDRLRKEMNTEIAEKVKKEIAAEKKKQAKELKQKDVELQNARMLKEQVEQEKKVLEAKLIELQKAAQKPSESSDKSNFKAMLASAYKELTGLIEYISTSESKDRETYMKAAYKIINASKEALGKIDPCVGVEDSGNE